MVLNTDDLQLSFLFQLTEQLKALKVELDSRDNDIAHLRFIDNIDILLCLGMVLGMLVSMLNIKVLGYDKRSL